MCPVVEVEIYNDKVKVMYLEDELPKVIVEYIYHYLKTVDYFVSAIPLTQVKKVVWRPEFSELRQSQMDLVSMSRGGKLFIKLNKHFKNRDWGFIMIASKPEYIISLYF